LLHSSITREIFLESEMASMKRWGKVIFMRAIQKVTSGELLLKQSMREKSIIVYNIYSIYMLKLLLNARIEGLIVVGNKFLYASVKEICYM
jgi:hypothetical protein